MTNQRCDKCGQMNSTEFLQLWMRTPSVWFGGASPLYMLKMGRGEKVAQFLDSRLQLDQPPVEPKAPHDLIGEYRNQLFRYEWGQELLRRAGLL